MRSRFHEQVRQAIQRLLNVAVPQQVLHALHLLRCRSANLWPFFLQRLGLLLQHRQPHGDVKPVDHMFTVGVEVLLHLLHIFTTVALHLTMRQPLNLFSHLRTALNRETL